MTMLSVPHMVEMGAETSVLAPLLVWTCNERLRLDRWALPARVAFPVFVLLHAAIVVGTTVLNLSAPAPLVLSAVLLVGAVLFWLPVLGRRQRLRDPARVVYLFVALPMLDLAGVFDVVAGDVTGGLAMIAAMLPAGVIAVAIAWHWLVNEDRDVVTVAAVR